MTELRRQLIRADDSPSIDAFGRWRVSNPVTIFDSKQIQDNQPLFWDESLETGAGITATHSPLTASTVLQSTLNTAGKFTRQTYQWFNYQPGKSQLILLTGILQRDAGGTGVDRRIGYFNDDNGLLFRDFQGGVSVVRRTNVTGTPVDNEVLQSSWNIDVLDGTGPSGITIDWSKTQIFAIDFEWLGVGRARMGVVVDGLIVYVHEFLNANILSKVYMSTPNLPLRYQMITTASSPASSMECICSTVISEGGQEPTGITRHAHTPQVTGLTTGTVYALIGIRLKTTHLGSSVLPKFLSILCATANDLAEWHISLNPTVAGTFTFNDLTNSAVQVAIGDATNTITGGTDLQGGFFSTSQIFSGGLESYRRIGSAIDGTRDILVLACEPVSTNININASLSWLEQA